jgi:glutamate-1-semialdehyde 2,1-aminomutase
MLANGVYLPPSAFESWFISASITTKEIDQTIEAVKTFA